MRRGRGALRDVAHAGGLPVAQLASSRISILVSIVAGASELLGQAILYFQYGKSKIL
jgi:hypothetical protein